MLENGEKRSAESYDLHVYTVEEHHVHVYAGTDNETIVKADRPDDLLRNSIATPTLAASIMNAKYINAVPLYRQEQEYKRNGLHIRRQSMANWVIRCSEDYLGLLYDRLHRELYQYHVLQADELCKALHNSSYEKSYVM